MRPGIAICGVLLAIGSASAADRPVGLATSNPGTLYFTQASAIAPLVKAKSGLQIAIQPFSSPNVHIPVVNAGQIDFGLANIHELLLALEGRDLYQGRKNENLRLVTVTAPLLAAFFVRKDSPIRSFADFRGKRLGWGYSQQPIVRNLIETHFESVGLKETDVVRVPVSSVVPGADEFAAGKTDVFFFALGSAKVAEVDARVGGIRAISLPDTAAVRGSLKKNFPPAYVAEVKPQPGFPGIERATNVMAYDAVMFTHSAASADLVRRVASALHENARALSTASPALRGFSAEKMAKNVAPIQYHSGAISFYEDKGLWPPK